MMLASSSSSRSNAEPHHLLAAIQAGDLSRLGELLQIYRNYLNLLADSQLDAKLRARVSPSDVVQEAMLRAHRDFQQFRGNSEAQFLAWLRQILVHSLARMIETHVLAGKRDVRREISLDGLKAALEKSTVQLGAALQGRDETPSADYERQERAVQLANLMSQLSTAHREVIVLRNLQGLAFDEVATRLNRSVPATKMLWMRAIKQLRLLYEGGESE